MKKKTLFLRLASFFCLLCGASRAHAQTPDILSFQNGQLVWTNSAPASAYHILWASSLTDGGNWHTNYQSLTDIRPDPFSLTVTSSVPLFYSILVTDRSETFTLSVTNGCGGSGSYTNGQTVSIGATYPAPFKVFDHWEGDTQSVANVWAANTTLTIQSANVALTAVYKDELFKLTAYDGGGSGSYTNQQEVAITANVPGAGKIFDRWAGDTQTVANAAASNTTVQIPGRDVAVAAIYKDKVESVTGAFALSVLDGTGGGSYTNNQPVSIEAAPSPLFRVFDRWLGDTNFVAAATNASTTLTMPGTNAAVAATYFWAPPAKVLPADPSAPGVPWPTNRFTIGTGSASNCVLDNLTGLTWLRNPPATLQTWTAAGTYCTTLDGAAGRGGYDDWRLPNVKELLSLVDFRYKAPCVPNAVGDAKMSSGDPFMNIGTAGYYYWSDTSHLSDWRYRWSISFTYGDGSAFINTATGSCQAWPVRGGQFNK